MNSLLSGIQPYDMAVLTWIQAHLRCGFLDTILPIVTALGNSGIIWIVIGLLLVIFPTHRRCGVMLLTAIFLGFLVGNLWLKPLIARMRPFDANTLIILIINHPTDFSFPSGHTLSSFAAATVVFLYRRQWGIAAYALACLIAFSRLYLFVHYPSDILAGMLIGTVLAACVFYAFTHIRKE